MDGAKALDVLHLRTRRRIGIGTITQPIVEQERSVSAPATRPQGATLRRPVTVKPISGAPAKWWSVERKSEEA
jgi:hypothetical protein